MTARFGTLALLSLILPLSASLSHASQRYSQYLDQETRVIKRPEGDGWADPFGDGVWRSSWFYASLINIKGTDPQFYEALKNEHGVGVEDASVFLARFAADCMHEDKWTIPKCPQQKFSRDQLVPMLYLLASVQKYSPECRPAAKDILTDLVRIQEVGLSDGGQGAIHDNLRYVIDVLADKYGVDYVDGQTRSIYKLAFSASLKADALQVQLPGGAATNDDFSVFNRLALVSLQGVIWGTGDSDVKKWRANYVQHADKGWGPAFSLVAGRNLAANSIDSYRAAYIKRSQDNDIIMGQRPHDYLSGQFPAAQFAQTDSDGWIVLDYIILQGLNAVWQSD